MLNGSAVAFCMLLVAFIGTLLTGMVVLQASCALFNVLVGLLGQAARPARRRTAGVPETETNDEPGRALAPNDESMVTRRGVPKPSWERALFILFVVFLCNAMASFIILRVQRLAGQVAGVSVLGTMQFHLVSSSLYILILGGVNASVLPTSFGKGLLVALLFLFLSILLGAILFVCLSIALAFGLQVPSFG